MTSDNIDDFILQDINIDDLWKTQIQKSTSTQTGRQNDAIPMPAAEIEALKVLLMDKAESHISSMLTATSWITPEDVFGLEQAKNIINKLKKLKTIEDVRVAVGGHFVEGLVSRLFDVILSFKSGAIYQKHLENVKAQSNDAFVMKTAYKYLNEKQKKRKDELRMIEASKLLALDEDKYLSKTLNKLLNENQKKRKAKLQLIEAAEKAKKQMTTT
ncbi:hypothetical protein PCANC_10755 [Puccinia coronata f. sp. avenae]|uniref:Uncharacterized protein n=1 Tax=Puccinia coronata f. sp. avenae TaxID=200324 RepID=A0A2N5VD19_9BASI|nr:hypothetical protein PCASD_04911 [Puccinia coronata f. sp. avenae]PLW53016.1 hypothetical protein PCANC_10755 [Puccinia coronata f. sp. avenae]